MFCRFVLFLAFFLMQFSLVMVGYYGIFTICGQSKAPLFCLVLAVGTKVYLLLFSFFLAIIFYLLKALVDFFFERIARSYFAKTLYLLSSIMSMFTLFTPKVYFYVASNSYSVIYLAFLLFSSVLVLYLLCMKSDSGFLDE